MHGLSPRLRTKFSLCFIGTAIVAFVLGVLLAGKLNKPDSIPCAPTHHYLNPDLDCVNVDIAYAHIDASEQKTEAYVNYQIQSGNATRISVFFRDLKTKHWYGVNPDDQFSPRSLLKLPLAIAYYKLSEIDPAILTQEFTYKQGTSLNQYEHFNSSTPLVVGKSYSVQTMLDRMIKDSDNDVVQTLAQYINKDFYNKVLLDLGVDVPTVAAGGMQADFLTAKIYAATLRTLYNSSYLSPTQSEKLLATLSESSFTSGLVAGVPKGTVIAHKFGEGTEMDPNTKAVIKRELHDCGIIYREDNPYILCVMTEGNNFDDLSTIIAHISQAVWQNTDMSQ